MWRKHGLLNSYLLYELCTKKTDMRELALKQNKTNKMMVEFQPSLYFDPKNSWTWDFYIVVSTIIYWISDLWVQFGWFYCRDSTIWERERQY